MAIEHFTADVYDTWLRLWHWVLPEDAYKLLTSGHNLAYITALYPKETNIQTMQRTLLDVLTLSYNDSTLWAADGTFVPLVDVGNNRGVVTWDWLAKQHQKHDAEGTPLPRRIIRNTLWNPPYRITHQESSFNIQRLLAALSYWLLDPTANTEPDITLEIATYATVYLRAITSTQDGIASETTASRCQGNLGV